MPIRATEQWVDRPSLPKLTQQERARSAAAAKRAEIRAIMSRAPADPRDALARAVERGPDSLAALSRMLGRSDGYLRRFLVDGVPVALTPDDHRRLADYFGLTQRELGIRDLWVGRR